MNAQGLFCRLQAKKTCDILFSINSLYYVVYLLNIPKYYIRDGLDHFEVVTPNENYVRIATEEDLKKYTRNATYTPGVLEEILNAIVDGTDWKEEYGDVVYKP